METSLLLLWDPRWSRTRRRRSGVDHAGKSPIAFRETLSDITFSFSSWPWEWRSAEKAKPRVLAWGKDTPSLS